MSINAPKPMVSRFLSPAFRAALIISLVFPFLYSASFAGALDELNLAAPTCASEAPQAAVPNTPTVPAPSPAAAERAPALKVTFVDVGQGDAIYIELPDGSNALVDGGPSRAATGALARFLAEKNITSIDHVVLTHPHSDHYKGLTYVFNNFKVGEFYDTGMDNADVTADEDLRALVAEKGARISYPAPGNTLPWASGQAEVKVLNSCPDQMRSHNGNDINNCSIVLKLAYNGRSVILSGDAQDAVEGAMLALYGDSLKADALKVAHHGSAYSSTSAFLAAVRPTHAYIEVGKNNYGHPTQSALGRLLEAGASVFRADLNGTQTFTVSGKVPYLLAPSATAASPAPAPAYALPF